jgi:parallel beta-helix repeat protein
MKKKMVSAMILTLLFTSMLTVAFHIQPAQTAVSPLVVPEESAAIQGTENLASQEPPPIEWNKTYGGTFEDIGSSVVQTVDGGYAIAGTTHPYGAGSNDFWLVKTDSTGNHLWNKTYGGTDSDYAQSVVETSDGGYAIAGHTDSFGAGNSDFWLVKTDGSGNPLWNKTYGGARRDVALSGVQTVDGGYALAGWANSGDAGGFEAHLVKTDASGNMQWNKTCGGTSSDGGSSVVQTVDGGYAIAGTTNSYGSGYWDFWLVKIGKAKWGTIYIRADGSIDPPDAPMSTTDNATYTLTENIASGAYGIVVERSSIIIDGNGWTLQGDGSGTGIDLSGRENVTVHNTQINAFYYSIYLSASSNNNISGNRITNNYYGPVLGYSSDHNDLSGNNVANNYMGIVIMYSSHNNIYGNNITANNNDGILLQYSSGNSIGGNNITANYYYGILAILSSNYTIISGNNITGNNLDGILLQISTDYNSVSGNNIRANNRDGIGLESCSSNSISENSITAHNGYGIRLSFSSDNFICHNDFIDNAYQVSAHESSNVWDDGYPSGGNYWSDYTDVDFNNDGIWDHPYVIDADNQDRYPLVNPWAQTVADSFRFPLDGLWTVSQRMGRWNNDWQGYHLGEDVLRSFEAPVCAPADGVVKGNAKHTGYGYVVIIEHQLLDGSFVCSVLGHLRGAGRIAVGSTVTKGQIVGYLSSLPEENGGILHLHFGIRKGMYSEELDPDGKWRYRGYGPIDIVGSWYPPSVFIEYYNLNREILPSYDLTINTEGGGAFASSTSVFTLVYKTILSLIAWQPWWQRWSGTDNDYQNPTTVTIDSHKAVTAWFRSEPPPPCPTPSELAKSLIGADYVWGGQGWNWSQSTQSWVGGKWLDANEIKEGYYFYNATAKKVEFCTGLDCSGLVFWAYNKWAYENLSHGSYSESLTDSANMIYKYANAEFLKSSNSDPIGKEELQPGDLLFFEARAGYGDPDHVAVYVGDFPYEGQTCNVVHATITKNGLVKMVTPAWFNASDETLHTPDPEWPGESLPVNRGYGRVFNYSDRAKPSYTCKSPIDLVVTDPDGVVLTKNVGEVPGMFYVEFDSNGNGELDDTVVVWDPKIGDYSITLVPEQGALPTDDFALEASANGTTMLLADHALISEIPTDPYIITQNETTITLRNINAALTNIALSKNVVGQGHSLSINTTVQNQGTFEETLNVTLFANAIPIGTQAVSLASGNSATLTFTWNTSGFAKGNYTISAIAEPIPGETYTADNTCTGGTVRVGIPGDVDPADGYVGIDDIFNVASHFGQDPGHPSWNAIYDIAGDDYVGIDDIFIAASHFGQEENP